MKKQNIGSPFQSGVLIKKTSPVKTAFRINFEPLQALNKRIKLWRGDEGWFANGSSGELWEYGKKMLGFTVATGNQIIKAIDAGFVPTQRGDGEANFSCAWTDENVTKLIRLLKLRPRRESF